MSGNPWMLLARLAAAFSVIAGALVLAGWWFGLPLLRSFSPALSPMPANVALAFVLAGICLWLRGMTRSDVSNQPIAIGCAAFVALIGLLTLAEYAFELDLRIDQMLTQVGQDPNGVAPPGRMAINAALALLLLGTALLLLDFETPRGRRPAEWLALLVAMIGYLALLGYLYGARAMQAVGPYSAMTSSTALVLVVLGCGILAVRPHRGLMSALANHTAGGVMVRRLLPAVILIPPFFGWLRALGQQAGWYEAAFGSALFVSSLVVVFSILIWRSGALLTHLTARLESSESALREGQVLLQTIVDNSPAVIYAKDLNGKYLLANRRFCELMRISQARVIGMTDFDLFDAGAAAAFRAMDERTATAGVALTEEETLPQDDGPRYYLSVKCPLRNAQGVIYGIFGISTDMTDRKHAEAERARLLVRERQSREEAEALNSVARALASERGIDQVVQQVTDAATRLTGAQFGAFFQNLTNDKGESYLLYTLSGAPREAFAKFGLPRNTALFEPTFRGSAPVRIDDVLIDPRYGKNAPHHGMPKGHPPVRSFLTVPVVSRSGVVLGGLFFGHAEVGVFDERAERIAVAIAAQAAAAVDNARLNESIRAGAVRLERQVGQLRLLDQITRAIDQRHDLASIFQVVIRSLEDHLPVDFGCLCLYDATAPSLTVAHVGVKAREMARTFGIDQDAQVAIDENGLARCVRGHFVHEPDITGSPFDFPRRLANSGLRSVVFAPLILESRVFGVLIVARHDTNSFTSAECEFLRQLCDHVALAGHQAQLYSSLQLAYDELRHNQQSVLQQERLRSLGQMASGVAHDINNAISPASLYVDTLLEREQGLSERGKEFLRTIQRAIGDVAETVSRMRSLYRPRDSELLLAPIDVNDAVRQVIELTRPRWSDMPQERGVVISLHTELGPGLPPIMGAETEIRDALTNLIFNAVDAMPEGGILTLRTRTDGVTAGRAAPRKGRHVCIEVIDSGLGMDEETRRRCLEPFYTTKGERGTGLGLTTVYGMAQRHGAELEIDSIAGAGTTVRLTFSATSSSVDTTTRQRMVAVERTLRVLLIDDDPVLLNSLTNVLMVEGHRVVSADGGRAGIEAFRAAHSRGEPFEAVITDLGMPHVDGRRVAMEIRGVSPTIPIIMLTGWGQRLREEDGVPPHVDRVISKPPKIQELRIALNEAARTSA